MTGRCGMRRESGLSVGFRLVTFLSLSNREFHIRGSEDRFDTLRQAQGSGSTGWTLSLSKGFQPDVHSVEVEESSMILL